MTVTEHAAAPLDRRLGGTPGPGQATTRPGGNPATGRACPVNDTVRNETPQAAGPADAKAEDDTRIEWRYGSPECEAPGTCGHGTPGGPSRGRRRR